MFSTCLWVYFVIYMWSVLFGLGVNDSVMLLFIVIGILVIRNINVNNRIFGIVFENGENWVYIFGLVFMLEGSGLGKGRLFE